MQLQYILGEATTGYISQENKKRRNSESFVALSRRNAKILKHIPLQTGATKLSENSVIVNGL